MEKNKVIKSIDEIPSDYTLYIGDNKKIEKTHLVYTKKGESWLFILCEEEKQTHISKYVDFLKEKKIHQKHVPLKLAPKDLIEEIIKNYNKNEIFENNDNADESESLKKELNEKILLKSKKLKASDIHIEVRQNYTLLKMRIHGEMVVVDKFTSKKGYSFSHIIYSSYTTRGGEADIAFDPKSLQSGMMEKIIDNEKIRLRLQSLNLTNDGFDLICRLLPTEENNSYQKLEELGYRKKENDDIELMLSKPDGAIFIVGVTGSGKSTTIKNIILKYIDEHEVKCISVEDPVEFSLPISQMSINREKVKDLKEFYNSAMNATLRGDPDVLFYGETRDELSANALITGVLTGHKTLSTIHASSWVGTLARLREIGVKSSILGKPDFVSGIVYQRLLPVLCPHCSKKLIENKIPPRFSYEKILIDNYEIFGLVYENIIKAKAAKPKNLSLIQFLQDKKLLSSEKTLILKKKYKELNSNQDSNIIERLKDVCDLEYANIRFRGEGCQHCLNGIVSRTVCAETIVPDENICALIAANKDSEAVAYWKTYMNGRTAQEDAIEKMKEGLLDPFDVEYYFKRFNDM